MDTKESSVYAKSRPMSSNRLDGVTTAANDSTIMDGLDEDSLGSPSKKLAVDTLNRMETKKQLMT